MTRSRRRAFTLLELIVASMLATTLMVSVLAVLAAAGRDRARLQSRGFEPSVERVVELLRWDLCNARTMASVDDGHVLVLTGNGGIDRQTLSPNGRLARVAYRIVRDQRGPRLVREQRYLDDAVRPEPWSDLVAVDVMRVRVTAFAATDADPLGGEVAQESDGLDQPARVPTRALLRVEYLDQRNTTEREFWLR